MRRLRPLVPYALLTPGTLWLLVFFAIPMVTMLSVSLQEGSLGTGYTFTGNVGIYPEALSAWSTQFARSLQYGFVASLVAILVGYPIAYTIAFRGGKHKNALLLLVVLPFFTSFLIRTISWKFILQDNGLVLGTLKDLGLIDPAFHLIATPLAVISGLVYNFLPFVVLPLYVSLERIDPRLIEAASDLYASRLQAFRRVTLPLSIPGLFACTLLTFIPAVGDFVNAELLGSRDTTMIGNVIEREYLTNSNYPAAAALSFVLMIAIIIGVFAYARAVGTEELTG